MLKINQIYIRLLFLLMIIVVALGAARAADQDQFDVFSLEVAGDIFGYVLGDFDGNRRQDIVLIYSPYDNYEARYLGLFLQNERGRYNSRPDYLSPLTSRAAQINAHDIDDNGISELLIIGSDDVSVVRFTANSGFTDPDRIIKQRTTFAFPLFHGILVTPFIFDLTEAPGLEMIIPGVKGYHIYEKSENGEYRILNQLYVPITSRNSGRGLKDFTGRKSLNIQLSFADIYVADGNLDGRDDLYFLWDRKLCLFFQDESGNFAQTPDFELDFYPADTRGHFESILTDFNGDRRPDAVVSYSTGGITNTETRIRFYPSGTDGRITPVYSREITLSDSHCNLILGDYDGDNNPELVVPAIEIGSLAVTKMLLMKKADLHLLIYNFERGNPTNEPVERIKYGFRFNFDDPCPTGEITVSWSADFNGDRLNDLVFSDGNGKAKFFWGRENEYLSTKPDIEINLDHPLEFHSVDLGSGTPRDIIVEHYSSGKTGRLTVLKNRKI